MQTQIQREFMKSVLSKRLI